MIRRSQSLVALLALCVGGCGGSGLQFHDYPKPSQAVATADECEGMAQALKANPAFAETGPFSLEVHTGYDRSTTSPSAGLALSQRLVADAFPELPPSTASELGASLSTRQPGRFLADCSWDRSGVAFEAPQKATVVGDVALPPPATSGDGRWMLVTGEISIDLARPGPNDTDRLFRLEEFACLLERSQEGWTLKRCAPTSLKRPLPRAPVAL